MLGTYRRRGANLPFTDPSGYHGVALEGWFWRLTVPATGDVIVAIAAVCTDGEGERWGMASFGHHPSGIVRWGQADDVVVDPHSANVKVGGLLTAGDGRLRVRLDGVGLDVKLHDETPFGGRFFGGLGPAQVVPGLSQYWHPHLPHARATGAAVVDGTEVALDGADAYSEKNWGAGGMPEAWWWGQAHVGDDRVCVAFAGGPAGLGPLKVDGTSLVVGDDRWVAPLQPLRVSATDERWSLVAHGVGTRVEVEGTLRGAAPLALPVPLPRERRVLGGHTPQHLAGALRVEVKKRGKVQLAAETALAGLERGRG